MKQFLVLYIDAISPFIIGVALYFFWDKLIPKDVQGSSYQIVKRRFRVIGIVLMILGVIIFITKTIIQVENSGAARCKEKLSRALEWELPAKPAAGEIFAALSQELP